MKQRLRLLTICAFLVAGCSGPKDATMKTTVVTDTETLLEYQDEITVDYLKSHLRVIAADSMEGRDTGSEGLKKTADYLAEQYRQMGLQPVGDQQTYFQKFDLKANKTDSIVFKLSRIVNGENEVVDRSVASRNNTANFVRAFGGTDTLSGEIVFAGFGVNDLSKNVTHLEGVDFKGKWVMVFQEIPHVVENDTLIDLSVSPQSRFRSIITQGGAEGMLLIPSSSESDYKQAAMQTRMDYGQPTGMRLAYIKQNSRGFSKGYNVISPSMAEKILGVKELREARESLIKNVSEFKPVQTGYYLTQTPHVSEVVIETKNVLALLEGADPQLKDEAVVMTSHYDHVGIGRPDSTGDRIYNGADDDGSGTVGLLNVARALSEAKANGVRPKRSILFLHVSAEEKGLLGSRYYSDHPVIPMDSTIANINVDMIGRIDPEHEKEGIENYAYIIGSEIISSEMDSLLKVANERSGDILLDKKYNDLKDPNQFYRRSDHWNFGRFGVPFVFFFTGVHEDYHRPGDEVEKIRFDKMANIIQTMYATAVIVANTENPPQVDNQAFINITKSNRLQ